MKSEIDSNTICGGFSHTTDSNGQIIWTKKNNKETQALNDTLDEIDLTYLQDISSKNSRVHIFSSAYWTLWDFVGTYSRIDYILGHKSSVDKFKKIEVVSSNVSNHKVIRFDIN